MYAGKGGNHTTVICAHWQVLAQIQQRSFLQVKAIEFSFIWTLIA